MVLSASRRGCEHGDHDQDIPKSRLDEPRIVLNRSKRSSSLVGVGRTGEGGGKTLAEVEVELREDADRGSEWGSVDDWRVGRRDASALSSGITNGDTGCACFGVVGVALGLLMAFPESSIWSLKASPISDSNDSKDSFSLPVLPFLKRKQPKMEEKS
jgi:hypothetical protein